MSALGTAKGKEQATTTVLSLRPPSGKDASTQQSHKPERRITLRPHSPSFLPE